MPADFAIRLSGGLAAMLLIAPSRVVPPAFFRTHCLVMLGLLVTAALVEWGCVPGWVLGATVAGAAASYLASATWGLGLPRVGAPLTVLVAFLSGVVLVWASRAGAYRADVAAFDAGSRLASAALMGSTLTAMLLGHHYLTAPAMSIDPLRRFVIAMAVSLAIRTILAGIGLAIWMSRAEGQDVGSLFLGMRWGMGILGPALATVLTWKTVQIRSTQSATGILYIGMTLVLFGELSGMLLGRIAGVEF
jgi:hypothetical protein